MRVQSRGTGAASRATIRPNAVVESDTLSLLSGHIAEVLVGASLTLTDTLTISSTGSYVSSAALLAESSRAEAGEIHVIASRTAQIGTNATVVSIGDLRLVGLGPYGSASVRESAAVTASTITISAPHRAQIVSARVRAAESMDVIATGSTSATSVDVVGSSDVGVGTDLTLSSGHSAAISGTSVVHVSGNLEMNAAASHRCWVQNTTTITYGTKSGVCVGKL
jgi:hypothetical protein